MYDFRTLKLKAVFLYKLNYEIIQTNIGSWEPFEIFSISLDGTGSKTYIREDGRGQAPISMLFGEILKVNPISCITSNFNREVVQF